MSFPSKEDYYTSDLNGKWKGNDIFNHRIHIIKSAIEAHNNQKYVLSIPVLFAHLEGIVRENLHVGFQEAQELKSNLGRHAIFHRYDVSYGSKVNYFKLIFIFDIIQSEICSKKAIA